MERYMDVFAKLAFVLLTAWVILAGLGLTTRPGARQKKPRRQDPKSPKWVPGITSAPSADDNLIYPMTW